MPKQNQTARRPRLAIYRRVSTTRQAEEGVSLDLQLSACLREADHIYGPGLYDYTDYADEGFSGSLGLRSQSGRKTEHRPRLSDMMEAVARGEIDAVFVYRIDRLFRSVSLAAHLLKDYFQEYEVGLVSVQDRIDASTPQGRVMIYVMVVMAEYFLEWMSENITASLRQCRAEGRFIGLAPYGWRRRTEEEIGRGMTASLVRDEEQGRWVVQMKEWYLAGWGIRRIAQKLHDLGVSSPTGQEWWTYSVIHDTITNPAHAGLGRVGDGQLVQGDWYQERYYDEATYQMILAKAEDRRQTSPAGLAAAHYPLAKVLRCGHCGNQLHGRRNRARGKLYYRCTTPLHKRTAHCARNCKPAEALESCVLGLVRELAEREDLRELARRELADLLASEDADLQAEAERLRRALQQADAKAERWADLYLSSQMPREQLEVQSQRLQAERERLQAALEEVEQRLAWREARERKWDEAVRRLESFPEVWEGLNPEERRELIESIVEYAVMTQVDGETSLRVKVLFMDEREFRIPNLQRKTPMGLSLRQLAALELHHQGLTKDQMARQMRVTTPCINSHLNSVLRQLDVATLEEAYELCREDIERYRPWLPLGAGRARPGSRTREQGLTEMQKQVCLLKLKGMHPSTIAKHLGIAASTVYVHLHNIRRATGTRTDREAAEKAVRLGLIETDEEVRPRLTARECAYIHYALEGRSDEWIAARFEVSPNCVLHFRNSVCEKLGIQEPREAPQWVRDHIQERLHRLPLGPLPTRKREDKRLGEETLQVLRLRAQDLSYEDIAREAGISPPTVGHHMRRAKKVLGVGSPAEAVEEAKRRGLI